MPRELQLSIGANTYTVSPVKIDRGKLYGTTEILALDDDGNPCQLVSMDESGTIIIPKGGSALGILSPDGKWVERADLKTVKTDGSPAELAPSSYTVVNSLIHKASAEDLLDISVKAFYHIESAPAELIAAIGDDIYVFDYCYHESYEPSPAFLLVSEQKLFMLTGTPNDISYVGLDEIALAASDEDDEDGDEEIDIDNLF